MDGWAWHVDAERFRNDRRKQNALVRAGWDPLRFTWHDLDGRPGEVVAEIQRDPRRGGLTGRLVIDDRGHGPVYEPHVPGLDDHAPSQAGRRCWGMRSCRGRVVSVARWKWPCRDRAQR